MMLDLAMKATLALAACWAVSRILRNSAPSARHALWTGVMAALLVLPVVNARGPRLDLALLPPAISGPTPSAQTHARADTANPVSGDVGAVLPHATLDATGLSGRTNQLRAPSLPEAFVLIWIAGALLAVARLGAAHITSRRLVRLGTSPSSRLLLAVEQAAAALRVDTPGLRICRLGHMPAVIGITRSIIVLPAEAESWEAERLELVLLHECAHVRRHDTLAHFIANMAACIYWWNPVMWTAHREIVRERELACDDIVISMGWSTTAYAEHLLEIARGLKAAQGTAAAALAMARPSELEGRVIALLDDRPRAFRKPGALVAAAAVAAAATLAMAPIHVVAKAPTRLAARFAERVAGPAPAAQPATPPAPIVHPDSQRPPRTPRPPREAPPAAQFSASVREAMRKGVTDASPVVRAAALRALLLSGDPEAPALISAAADDESAQVRTLVISALVDRAHPDRRALLLSAARDTSEGVRAQAALGLAREAGGDIDALLASLAADPSSSVRRSAVIAFMDRPAPDLSAVRVRLTDLSADVRAAAALAVSERRDQASIPLLIAALGDASAAVRRSAALGLGTMAATQATEALVAATRDFNADVRRAAFLSLSTLTGRAPAAR